jgi:hypothetical protein
VKSRTPDFEEAGYFEKGIFMKTGKRSRKTKNVPPADNDDSVGNATPSELLRLLATATTAYHEAPPDRVEEARLVYEEALQRFRGVQSRLIVRTVAARASVHVQGTE